MYLSALILAALSAASAAAQDAPNSNIRICSDITLQGDMITAVCPVMWEEPLTYRISSLDVSRCPWNGGNGWYAPPLEPGENPVCPCTIGSSSSTHMDCFCPNGSGRSIGIRLTGPNSGCLSCMGNIASSCELYDE